MSKNLIVILSDEHQASALGCAGHSFVQTPHLDKLAGRGMRFENAYTPSPICVPARAAFASGQYVHQTSHWDNATPYINYRQQARLFNRLANCIIGLKKMIAVLMRCICR